MVHTETVMNSRGLIQINNPAFVWKGTLNPPVRIRSEQDDIRTGNLSNNYVVLYIHSIMHHGMLSIYKDNCTFL